MVSSSPSESGSLSHSAPFFVCVCVCVWVGGWDGTGMERMESTDRASRWWSVLHSIVLHDIPIQASAALHCTSCIALRDVA